MVKEQTKQSRLKRSGAETYFIGAVGNDGAGAMMTDLMSQDEINLTGVTTLEKNSYWPSLYYGR